MGAERLEQSEGLRVLMIALDGSCRRWVDSLGSFGATRFVEAERVEAMT